MAKKQKIERGKWLRRSKHRKAISERQKGKKRPKKEGMKTKLLLLIAAGFNTNSKIGLYCSVEQQAYIENKKSKEYIHIDPGEKTSFEYKTLPSSYQIPRKIMIEENKIISNIQRGSNKGTYDVNWSWLRDEIYERIIKRLTSDDKDVILTQINKSLKAYKRITSRNPRLKQEYDSLLSFLSNIQIEENFQDTKIGSNQHKQNKKIAKINTDDEDIMMIFIKRTFSYFCKYILFSQDLRANSEFYNTLYLDNILDLYMTNLSYINWDFSYNKYDVKPSSSQEANMKVQEHPINRFINSLKEYVKAKNQLINFELESLSNTINMAKSIPKITRVEDMVWVKYPK